MSTPAEEQYLVSSAGQRQLASSIYNAIVRYVAQRQGNKVNTATLASPTADDTPSAAADDTPEADNTPAATPSRRQQTPAQPSTTAPRTVYRIQVLSGAVKLKPGDRQFKGLKCDMHQTGGRYIYTYGKANTLSEAKKLRKSILSKFPDAFIATFKE